MLKPRDQYPSAQAFFDAVEAKLEAKEREGRDWSPLKKDRPKCGARTRAGGQCQARAVWDREKQAPVNGRCRLHGGLSTGPKTIEGKAKCAANLPND